MKFGLILLLDQLTSTWCATLSQEVVRGSTALMRLGAASPPHVTVLHFEADDRSAREVWESLRNEFGGFVTLRTAGLMVSVIPVENFYVPEGGVYFGLEVDKAEQLQKLHQIALAHAVSRNWSVLGAVDRAYRPHITLGVLSAGIASVNVPVKDLASRSFSASLCLGRLGAYGTFPNILYSE